MLGRAVSPVGGLTQWLQQRPDQLDWGGRAQGGLLFQRGEAGEDGGGGGGQEEKEEEEDVLSPTPPTKAYLDKKKEAEEIEGEGEEV